MQITFLIKVRVLCEPDFVHVKVGISTPSGSREEGVRQHVPHAVEVEFIAVVTSRTNETGERSSTLFISKF